jgi:hypothetical protein
VGPKVPQKIFLYFFKKTVYSLSSRSPGQVTVVVKWGASRHVETRTRPTLCFYNAYTTQISRRLERDGGGMIPPDAGSSPARLQPERDGAPAQYPPTKVLSMTRGQATATRPNPEARIRGGDSRPTPLVESHVTASTGFWSDAQNIVHPENPKKPSARTNQSKPGSERRGGYTVSDALTATL